MSSGQCRFLGLALGPRRPVLLWLAFARWRIWRAPFGVGRTRARPRSEGGRWPRARPPLCFVDRCCWPKAAPACVCVWPEAAWALSSANGTTDTPLELLDDVLGEELGAAMMGNT